MKLGNFFKALSFGPFSNLALGNDGDGTILPAKVPMVISHISEGLLELYGRFNLKESEVVIQMTNAINFYELKAKYSLENAAANPTLPHYLIDSPTHPFMEDVLKISSVSREDGFDLPIDDDTLLNSVFLPEYDVVQVPDPEEGKPLYVVYIAKHAELVDDPDAPGFADQEIDLPDVLIAGLKSFVAWKVYANMNGQENAAIAAGHKAAYEENCKKVIDQDLVNTSSARYGRKFSDRGFV